MGGGVAEANFGFFQRRAGQGSPVSQKGAQNAIGSPAVPESRKSCLLINLQALVGALREQRNQNHEVGKGKQPLIGLDSGRFRGTRDESEMAGLGEIVHVLDADARQARNF